MNTYEAKYPVNSLSREIRGLSYCIHTWGKQDNPPLFLLHGWADTGLSFQFVADELGQDYFLIAPDWRGFGDSEWSPQGYWFPDYLGDLDEIVEQYANGDKARIAGHSMGGNVGCLYAGIRKDKVSHLASLDVFGLPASDPSQAPGRYEKWLDQLKDNPSYSTYEDMETLLKHIRKLAPGINEESAAFIARAWAKPLPDQRGFTIKADPAHKRVNPVLYRREEARSCWQGIHAKTLFIYGEDSRIYQTYLEEGYQQESRECIPGLLEDTIADAGHMLHWQQPRVLAAKLKQFFEL